MNMISNVPEEMLSLIVDHLPPNDVINFSRTCRYIHQICDPLFINYRKTINQIFDALSAQQKRVEEEINSKYEAYKAKEKELNTPDLTLLKVKFSEKEIYSLFSEFLNLKKDYETCLCLRRFDLETLTERRVRNRKFATVLHEIFKPIIGKEKPVVEIQERAASTSDKEKLAQEATSNAITVFVSPEGLRTVILKNSECKFEFIQEYFAGILRISTSGPLDSDSRIYITNRMGKIDLQELKKSAEFLRPIIEEICPKPKDDEAAAAAL